MLARSLAGWLLVGALFYAPWAMAGLPIAALHGLQLWLGITFVLWLVGTLLIGERPALPRVMLACAVGLLGIGWWMTLNASGQYEAATDNIIERPMFWPSAPGAMEAVEARLTTLTMTALLGALCVVIDLAREPRWRWRLAGGLAAAATSIGLLGITQKLGLVDLTNWHPDRPENSPMGPFDYHANAASFLNLGLPIVAAVAFWSWRTKRAASLRWAWAGALGVTLAAGLLTGSKAGVPLTLLTLAGLVGWGMALRFAPRFSRQGLASGAVAAAIVGGVAVLLAWPAITTGAEKLQQIATGRVIIWRISSAMARDAGPLGFGPGSYKLAMPESEHFDRQLYRHWIVTRHTPGTRPVIWVHAHQDYLQLAIEWGWLGFLAAAGLVLGGLLRLVRSLMDRLHPRHHPDRVLAFALLLALAVLGLHAMVDFPLQIPAIQLQAFTCLGLAWAISADRPRTEARL